MAQLPFLMLSSCHELLFSDIDIYSRANSRTRKFDKREEKKPRIHISSPFHPYLSSQIPYRISDIPVPHFWWLSRRTPGLE